MKLIILLRGGDLGLLPYPSRNSIKQGNAGDRTHGDLDSAAAKGWIPTGIQRLLKAKPFSFSHLVPVIGHCPKTLIQRGIWILEYHKNLPSCITSVKCQVQPLINPARKEGYSNVR